MANNTISQVEINSETYDILDANASLRIYPVGSIYMSVNSTSPSTLFGGTWERIQDRFLLAAGSSYTAGATGGEATHKLTAAESGVPAHGHGHSLKLPNHVHSMTHNHAADHASWSFVVGVEEAYVATQSTGWGIPNWTPRKNTANYTGNSGNPTSLPSITGSVSNNTAAAATNAHNNMPPYLAVYVWKRTA